MPRLPVSLALGAVVLGLAGPALADSFAGFTGDERRYVVSPAKVCSPVVASWLVHSR